MSKLLILRQAVGLLLAAGTLALIYAVYAEGLR